MFKTDKQDLKDILRDVDEGKLQLPDFQRDYVWKDDDVRSLIASIARGFPVGALLTLETGGEVNFKPRILEGVTMVGTKPDELLLDGQQRMTSLYQAMHSSTPVQTRNVRNQRLDLYYYIDIEKSVENGVVFEDVLRAVPATRVRHKTARTEELDLSRPELEYAHNLFPLNRVFDNRNWFYAWRDYWRQRDRDVADLEREFYKQVVEVIERYEMPIIRLDKNNSREAICLVFEKVNVGGQKLDAFELVTAVYAADEFDLRKDWSGDPKTQVLGRRQRMLGQPPRDVLREVASTDFLQACTLLYSRDRRLAAESEGAIGKELPQITCRREALLALPLAAYRQYADRVEAGFVEAAKFLNAHKIIWHKDIPYPPQRVALAAVFAILGKEARPTSVDDKLAQWFWSVTLGELYGSATESRLARDVPDLVQWIRGHGGEPRSLDEAVFQSSRLRSLRTRNSAAYKGIHALLMRAGCEDFITGKATEVMTFFNDDIDIHHIFPRKWCKKNGIPAAEYDAIINKTPLSKLSNIAVGGDAPSIYLKRIEEKYQTQPDRLDAVLRTHLIEPEHLRNDDFYAFYQSRQRALEHLVEHAMQKTVVQQSADAGDVEGEEEAYDEEEALA